MNKQRRKNLMEVIDALENCSLDIECLLDEEQDSYDSIPESLQESERGQLMENAIDCLDSARGSISDAIESIEDAIGS